MNILSVFVRAFVLILETVLTCDNNYVTNVSGYTQEVLLRTRAQIRSCVTCTLIFYGYGLGFQLVGL